ncbi:MAG: Flp family type IVb pilin [Actinomycetota bacterium]
MLDVPALDGAAIVDPSQPPDEAPTAHAPGWRERGATLVEYALLIALIALVAMAGVQVMGGAVGSAIDDGASSVQQAGQ